MGHGALSEQIRNKAVERYIRPAMARNELRFAVPVRDLMVELEAEGFPRNHPHQFCTAIQKKAFLDENGLTIERVDGPPSGRSTTVVVHYRLRAEREQVAAAHVSESESAADRAKRVTDLLGGRLRRQIKSFGGAADYVAWVRREGE